MCMCAACACMQACVLRVRACACTTPCPLRVCVHACVLRDAYVCCVCVCACMRAACACMRACCVMHVCAACACVHACVLRVRACLALIKAASAHGPTLAHTLETHACAYCMHLSNRRTQQQTPPPHRAGAPESSSPARMGILGAR